MSSHPAVTLELLRHELAGKQLPGANLTVEQYENTIATRALRSEVDDGGVAHPIWFIIFSLRGMGVTVAGLCELAHAGPDDTLLYGEVAVEQELPLRVGGTYRIDAAVTDVGRSTMRDGSTLDKLTVRVELFGDGTRHGSVSSTYLFKRGESG
jgi:hypothetical protein